MTPTETGTLTYTLTCAGGGYGESQRASATLTVDPAGAFTQTLPGGRVCRQCGTHHGFGESRGISVGLDAPVRVVSGGRSNEYDGNGKRQSPSRASGSGGSASTTATRFESTGIVANTGADFIIITAGGRPDTAGFLVADTGGMIGALPRARILPTRDRAFDRRRGGLHGRDGSH